MNKSKKVLALALTVALGVTALAGCGGGNGPAPGSSTQATSDKGQKGELIFAQGADPRGLDPGMVDDAESSKVMCQIYETLLAFEKDSTKLRPWLAKEYEVSEDGLTYTFILNEGIKFHDGEPFNAEAVKANIERYMEGNRTEDMPYADFVYGKVASVEAPEEYKVVIKLKEPYTPFLNNLAMSMTAPMASPKAIKEGNLMEHPVGTGPFVFDSWNKGQDITLKPNLEYWNNGPEAKGAIFRIIAENSARVVALKNGEVNIIDGIDPNSVEEIKASGAELYTTPGMNINYMAYNTENGIFKDEAARKAISMAINVPELVKNLYKDQAQPATTILPEFVPGFSKDVKQVAYDKAAAEKAIKDAKISKVRIMTYTNPRPYNPVGGQVLAEAIQGYLKAVGVDATIDSYDWTTYKDKLKSGDYDICFYGWNGDNGDADNFMGLLSDSDPSMNVARYNDPEYKAMVQKAATIPNGEQRDKAYAEMEQYVADKAVWLPFSHMDVLTAYSPSVKNYYFHVTANIYMQEMYADTK